MLSRGQAWAEYIIILAVVIIMAGVAMYTAGAFAGSTKHVEERDSAAYWLTADVGITRYYVNSSLSQFVIKNNKNYRIILTSITSSGSGTLIAPGGASNITLEPGQTVQVNVSGLNCSSSQYSFPLDITYADAKYGVIYSFQGEKPLVGSCMGLSPMPVPPECSSNPDCGINSTACNSYCNGNLLCSFSSNPATCQRNCVSQKCKDCNASCGNASCASCGINTTTCPAAYCNGNQSCTYPLNASCNIPCSGGNCTGCNTTCTATCTNCPPAARICTGNGNCVACNNNGTCDTSFGENYSNCPADCCGSGMYSCSDANNITGTCRSGCSGFNCINFKQVCDNQPWSASRCSNSTGGSSGSLDYYVGGCCNGTVYYCGSGKTCNQTSPHTTSCITKCLPDCTSGDSTCHSSCSGSCLNFKDACDTVNLNSKACSNISGGTANPPLNYYVTCCNGTITSCGTNTTTCPAAYCNGNQSCTYPLNASCNIPCSGGNCTGCTTLCIATCTTCPTGTICLNGQCLSNCLPNCTTGDSICHSSCSGTCSNFRPVCDNQSLNAQRCSDATGTTTSNTNYTTCCNGAIASAPSCYQNTSTTVGWCGDAKCDAAQGETYSSCPSDCCNSDCTGKTSGGGSDNTCHQQCSPYCSGWQPVCDTLSKGSKTCSDGTHYVTCCNAAGGTCSGGTPNCQSGQCVAAGVCIPACPGGTTCCNCQRWITSCGWICISPCIRSSCYAYC